MHFVVGVVLDSHEESVDAALERFGMDNEQHETHTVAYVFKEIRDTYTRSLNQYTKRFEEEKAKYLALDPADADKIKAKQQMDMYQGWVEEYQQVLDYSDEQMIKWLEEEAPYIDDLGNIDEVDVEKDTIVVNIGNPEAQWDWYVIGGRWRGSILPCKPDADPSTLIWGQGGLGDKGEPKKFPDGCYIKDITFEALLDLKKAEIERLKGEDKNQFWFHPKDGRDEYWKELQSTDKERYQQECKDAYIKSKEDSIKGLSLVDHLTDSVYAYIDLEGEWNEDKEFYNYISKHPDAYVAIVDIHF